MLEALGEFAQILGFDRFKQKTRRSWSRALLLRTTEALEDLCICTLLQAPWTPRWVHGVEHRAAALHAVAQVGVEAHVTRAWIEDAVKVAHETAVVKAAFRPGWTCADVLEEDNGKRCRSFLLATTSATPRGSSFAEARALFLLGFKRGLSAGDALECMRQEAGFTDLPALFLFISAQGPKRPLLASKRICSALGEAVFYYSGLGRPSQGRRCSVVSTARHITEGLLATRQDCMRVFRELSSAIDLIPLTTRSTSLEVVADLVLSRASPVSSLWTWHPVRDSVAEVVRRASRGEESAVGTERVVISRRRDFVTGGALPRDFAAPQEIQVGGRVAAERQSVGLSVPPSGSLRFGDKSDAAREALAVLCDAVGLGGTADLLVQARDVKRRHRSHRHAGWETRLPEAWSVDVSTASGLAGWAGYVPLRLLAAVMRTRPEGLEKLLLLRALALRLLMPKIRDGGVPGLLLKTLLLSTTWEGAEVKRAPRTAEVALQQVLYLGKTMAPESEANDAVSRALVLVSRGWLEAPPACWRGSRSAATRHCTLSGLAGCGVPPCLECGSPARSTHSLPREEPIVDATNSLAESMIAATSLHEATRLLGANTLSLPELVDAHNQLDRAGAEARRRVLSQACVFWAFGAVPACAELASFSLARGGIAPETSLSLLEVLIRCPAVASRKRKRAAA